MDDQYEEELSEGIAHQSSIDSTAMGDVKEDNEVCEICLDGEVFDDNEILFCDKCNVAVHQHCYGIKHIPQDSWFCFPCQEGLDPKTLTCELCSYSGGAYKRCTKGSNKWAHPLCASWIPEVYEVSVPGKSSLLNLERLDLKRYKLKCGLCTKKGACVQCAYGRCTQGMHPWCALRSSQCTRRIIKGDEGILLWEIFCKTHANAVGEAPKHRSKAKASKVHDDTDGHDDMAYWSSENPYLEEKEQKKETAWKDPKWPSSSTTEVDLVSKTVSQLITELRNQEISKTVVHASDDPITNQVVSLLEWPGMSEGEAMDLEHFWNYISSFYVEDHSEMWVETTIDAVKTWKHLTVDEAENSKENNEDDLEDAIDDALTTLGGEREKSAALNPSKRSLLLSRVHQIAEGLRLKSLRFHSLTSSASEAQSITAGDVLFENELFLLNNPQHSIADSGYVENQNLNVVFDGESRVGCKFEVTPSYFSETAGIGTGDDNRASQVENFTEWSIQNIIPQRKPNPAVNVSNVLQDAKVLELIELIPINESEVIQLSDGEIRPRSELSELMVIMLKDIHAYKQIVNSILTVTKGIVETTDLLDSTGKFQLNNLEWKEINNKYMNQQIWKKISQSVYKGVNHRGDEVPKNEDEPLPPSWALEVEGRPKAGSPDADEEEEAQEDGLCMCCFDGTSSDNNRIVFCDGCNASMHQVCYGIAEIPEGDYYCDRCKFIEKLALTLDEVDLDAVVVKETVKCCLCNLHHGGIKPTTDGRWVHVCCALWSGEAEVMDMKDMSPINISNLVFHPFPVQREKKRNNYLYSENACIYCHQSSGFLVTCSYCQNEPENDSVLLTCNHMFHPLCSWFAGASVKATITDPSYEARQREGRYPAGIEYQFRCHNHGETDNSATLAETYRHFRNKYRIKEGDLEQVPGKAKRKRKKYQRKKEGTGRKATSTSSAPKELPPDLYSDTVCASCMRPVSNDIFGNGYNSHSLNEIPPLETALVQKAPSTDDQSSSIIPFSEEKNNPPLSSSETVIQTSEPSSEGNKIIPAQVRSVSCSNCKLTLHHECWAEYRKSSEIISSVDSGGWLCNVCKESDYQNVHCALCPRRGGFFCHTVDGTWAHPYCARSIPAQTKITAEKRIDIRLISKEGKKQKCAICNRKGGICIQCSCVGCVSFFHPLCAARSNKGFVRIRNGVKEAFCQEHIPVGVDFIAGYWLDGQELFRFRLFLDRARIILDTLVRREKLKRTLCKTEAELMQTKISKLLDKAKGRKTKVSLANGGGESDEEDEDEKENEEDCLEIDELEEDDESIDDELFDEFVPLDYLSERLKRKSTPTTVPVELSNGEMVDVGLTWYNIVRSQQRSNHSLKKLTKVYFAGIEIKEKNTNLDRKSYIKHQKNYIYSNEDQLRTGTFADRRAEEKFAQEIGPNLIKMMKLNDKEFKSQVMKPDDKIGLEVRFEKVKFFRNETSISTASAKKRLKGKNIKNKVVKHGKAGRGGGVGRPAKSRDRNTDSDSFEDEPVDDESDGNDSLSEEELEGDEEDGSEEEEVPVRRRGRPRRNEPPTPSFRRKRHREEDSEAELSEENVDSDQDSPVKKKTKKSEEKDSMGSLLVKIREHESSKFYVDMMQRFPVFDLATQSTETNNLSGFDQYLCQINNASTALDTKINLFDWRIYQKRELFRLERWIQDMLECLSAYFLYESENIDIHLNLSLTDYILQRAPDYALIYSSEHVEKNGKDHECELKTPVKQNSKKANSTAKKSQGKRQKPETERENDFIKLSPLNHSHRKGSAPNISSFSYTARERNLVEENGRYLCDDFNDIPYDLIPDYDDSVRRVMTINIMREKLHHHYYHNFASFAKDFYLMLNNARSVTSPNNITWKDTKLLDKLFQESKGLLETKSWSQLTSSWKPINIQSKVLTIKHENNQTKGRKSINAEPLRSTRRRSGVIPVKEENEKISNNKDKSVQNPHSKIFTCYHCRLQHEIMNWPEGMKLPDAIPSSIVKEENKVQEVLVKMEVELNSSPTKNEMIDTNPTQGEGETDGPRRSKRFQSIASPAASLNFEEPSALPEPMEIEDPTIEHAEAKSDSLDDSASMKGSRTSTPSHAFSPKVTRSSLRERGKAETTTPSLPTVKEEATPEIEKDELDQKGSRKVHSMPMEGPTTPRSWSWVCSRCLHKDHEKLLNHEIQVWWHDDFCTYTGVINAYDSVSHCHRILYFDDEWEFVYLGQEAFLISYSLPSSVDENKRE